MSSNIAKPSKRYLELEEERDLSRTLKGGTKAMMEAGEKYMPRHPAEEPDNYKVRLQSTTLYNGYASSLLKAAGKIFAKPVTVNSDVPDQLLPILDNIDGQGRNITLFLFDVLLSAEYDGIDFVFTDYTSIEQPAEDKPPLTALDVKNMGARPTVILYGAEQVIGWESENINGVQTLTCVRIKECVTEQGEDEWTEKEVEQIRVLRPGSYEIWRKTDQIGNIAVDWYLYDSGITALNYIPLHPYYTNRTGYFEGLPPFQALAELNKQHWNSSSEQVQALTFARFAMMVFSGLQPDDKIGKVGPNQIIRLPNSDSKWGLIETAGKGIEAGRQDIEDIEKRMLSSGMTARVETKAGVTATASAIDSKDADSILMAWATALEDLMQSVLQDMANYEGLKSGGTIEVNKSFAMDKPEGSAADLLDSFNSNAISHETYLNEIKRRDILSDSVDVLEELARIKEEADLLLSMQKEQQQPPNPYNVDISNKPDTMVS